MISPQYFFALLQENGFTFYAGVPDSLLKSLCAYITDNTSAHDHVIAANEGNAIALAAGHYLATGNPGIVYLQNSGLGNCINPLVSLVDREVYSIPLLLIVGWRGEPGIADEPQHIKQGKITPAQLDLLGIPYQILPDSEEKLPDAVQQACRYMQQHSAPYAFIVRKNTFADYKLQYPDEVKYILDREEALKLITPLLEENALIISTTGKLSRELFELRVANQQGHQRDFLTVGSMGHSSSIALGLALAQPRRTIYCFDGDGALIMHQGALAIIGQLQPRNFKHIIFNNIAHDSVGGQPTAGDSINIPNLALANNYAAAFAAQTREEIQARLQELKSKPGPVLLEIRCNKGARKDLGRPTRTPLENKTDFMTYLQND